MEIGLLVKIATDEEKEILRYPQEMRSLIYTTNAIENLNSIFRKVTKAKKVFPSYE